MEQAEMSEKPAKPAARGLVIVNTGHGKGKTTAALGMMTRAWGRHMRVGGIQFIKSAATRSGESRAVARMGIDWIATGDGWTWDRQDTATAESRALAGWEVARQRIACGEYDLLILDEFTYPLHYGWLDTHAVVDWLGVNRPPSLHLVITGRYAPQQLIEFADLVTEMREIKHPFRTQRLPAQAGVEF
jgi:cob(I)alamin adenosyltransferase